jgi:type IV pilus assembly protein PilC
VLLLLAATGAVSAWCIVGFRLYPLDVVRVAAVVAGVLFCIFTLLYFLIRLIVQWIRRLSVDRVVISQIGNVVRQKLPLAEGVLLAADSERGLASMSLRGIGRALFAGRTLSEAIQIGWRDCPGLVLSLIIAGERAGQLPMAVDQAEQYLIQRARRRDRIDAPVLPYAAVVTAATCLVTGGVMVAIIPKYKEIFKDFDTALPRATRALINVSEWCAAFGLPILLVLGIFAFVILDLRFRPRRVPDPRWTSLIADWIRWHMPGFRKMERSGGLAAGLRAMEMGLNAGLGLPDAARLAADLDVNVHLRSRLARFAQLLDRGTDVARAAEEAGLGRVSEIALASGRRGHDMHAALRYAADYHDALISRWWVILGSLAWPITTLCLGMAVAFIAIALFMPLVALINAVSRG